MEVHPVAALFPLMGEEEFASLKADIAANGQREPVWLHQGRLIDGRNRYRACTELGLEPKTATWDGNGSLVAFVVSLNLHRRHLSAGQRAMVAAEMLPLLEAEAKERQRASGGDRKSKNTRPSRSVQAILPEPIAPAEPRPQARDEAARAVNVAPRYVQDAKKVAEQAPDLAAKVKAGELTLPQARTEVKRREKRADLEARAAAVEAAPDRPRAWEVRCGDCLAELEKVDGESVNLVFADPPYNIGIDYGEGPTADRLPDRDYLFWVEDWLRECERVLAGDGSLWVLIGDEYAAEYAIILNRLGLHRRAWVKWYETFGVCNSAMSNFSRTSRHLFYCVKDARRYAWDAEPVSRPSDRQARYGDARANPGGKVWDDVWQIPRLTGTSAERVPDFPTQLPLDLLLAVVGCSSRPGDLVLDPFSGSGTTGVAALRLGRRYLGIERSPHFARLAGQRLQGEQGGDATGWRAGPGGVRLGRRRLPHAGAGDAGDDLPRLDRRGAVVQPPRRPGQQQTPRGVPADAARTLSRPTPHRTPHASGGCGRAVAPRVRDPPAGLADNPYPTE